MDDPENVLRITSKFVNELTVTRMTETAINGYGVSQLYVVKLLMLDSHCRICGGWAIKTPLPLQVIPKNRACHSWKQEWLLVASASSPSLDLAYQNLDKQAKTFADKYIVTQPVESEEQSSSNS